MWKTAKPFLESWIKDQVGIPALVRSLKEKGPFWIEKMPEIPELVYDSLRQSKNLQHSMDKIAHELQSSRVRQGQSRYLFGIGATLLDKRHVAVDRSSGLGNDASLDYGCRCGCLACWLAKTR
ncbi:hypothetical protein ACVXG7_28355 [Enterobacter hormaechei]